MEPLPDLSLVIPAFNERARLPPTVRAAVAFLRARGGSFEIVVVDDGSTDATADAVRELAAEGGGVPELRLVRLDLNRGKGAAVRAGVAATRGPWVLVLDADNSTPIGELARLEAAIARGGGGADLAIGSRGIHGPDVRIAARWYRHLLGRCFHALVRLAGLRGLHDTQCGFKLFRGDLARRLFALGRRDRYAYDVEILLLARAAGFRIAEVPVNWTHQPGSKINLLTDSARMALDLLRIRLELRRGEYGRAEPAAPVKERG